MPTYRAPRSDLERQAFLETAAKTGQEDIDAGNNYISQELVEEINAFVPGFDTKVEAVTQTLSGREKEVREKNEAVASLITYTHDLWEVLRRRVNRKDEPAEVLTYYRLPLDGKNPTPNSDKEWLTMAENVVEGDAQAVAAGFDAMANPSAAELDAVRATTQTEVDEVAPADRQYDEAQEEAATLRPQADELILEVIDSLRFTLRKKDAPSQRRIMRTYGATFTFLRGETIEGTVDGGATENILDAGFDDETNFRLQNTGDVSLTFCRTEAGDTACAAGQEVEAGGEATVVAADLGTGSFLNVTNADPAAETGSYKVTVNPVG